MEKSKIKKKTRFVSEYVADTVDGGSPRCGDVLTMPNIKVSPDLFRRSCTYWNAHELERKTTELVIVKKEFRYTPKNIV